MMGPFVPNLISDELSLVVAFFIGLGFGYVLEQAGFSSAKRLVGLFYGYDFTVLRVFFTAALTAGLGSIALSLLGCLDLSAVFVNPLFLWPAIVGGVIMGGGFILGGYCPGTSIAAAAIGKLDGMWFVFGGLMGILVYGEAYPLVARFVNSSSMGALKVYDALHMSQGGFILFLAFAAIAAFWATGAIERKVNPETAPSKSLDPRWVAAGGTALAAAALVLGVMPDRQTLLTRRVSDAAYIKAHPVEVMEPDELALYLLRRDQRTRIYDLRKPAQYAALALPRSVNLSLSDLFGTSYADDFAHPHIRKVFVADTQKDAEEAARIASALGVVHVAALAGGVPAFQKAILAPGKPELEAIPDRVLREFREEAQAGILQQIKEAKAKGGPAAKVIRKVKGGC